MKFRQLPILILIISFHSLLYSQTTDTLFYSVMKGVDKAGYLKSGQSAANQYHSAYKFNDRGRGESVVAEVTTDESGLITKEETKGVEPMLP